MNNFLTSLFASKRNWVNLIAMLVMLVQYLADQAWIPVKEGALAVFVLNLILGTWFSASKSVK